MKQLLKQYLFFSGCVLGLLTVVTAQAQVPPPAIANSYFRDPLGIPISLAANFGEIRKGHYHMGLDIRTQQKENLPVYAAAAGYISRISIEKGGFGKAIYITHPAGYTTVYVHLNKFYDSLDRYVQAKQYTDKSWEQDCDIPAGLFPVAKGQFIAWSGNTGASQGPHLHFEIRDNKTGNNLNPLLFPSLGVEDATPPAIYGLYWYNRNYSTYQTEPKRILLKRQGGDYVSTQQVVKVGSQRISLGIRAEDKTSSSSFMFGIYQASVLLDDSLQSSFALNGFSYNDTRYINACVDYTTWVTKGTPIQHLSRLPGNELPVFTTNEEGGMLQLKDSLPHQVNIEVKDAAGNTSRVHFTVQYDPALQENLFFTMNGIPLQPNTAGNVTSENVKVHFGEFCLYDAVNFVLAETPNKGWPYASVQAQLHNYKVPVHEPYTVSLKLSRPELAQYADKIVMVQQSPVARAAIKPIREGDWFTGSFKSLGSVQLVIDNEPPSAQPTNFANGTHVGLNSTLHLRCGDNIDVKKVAVTVDGNWLLFTHSYGDYVYAMDDHFPLGEHTVRVTVTDLAGNVTVKEYTLTKEDRNIAAPVKRSKKHSSGKKKSNGSSSKRRK
ncbi:peptidoglycan DD-metalloendopeptidase family protein [Deminuibacter soli]|uniref:M23 family peptidase n=1 Tax=Deminuibacter soli TaxID=2291815 RepID=A0A3E1NRD8_9BACT|nr:peptidoglycan DD-metalloendopeptidase family protein [Deminuibacter soli]RFM30506.1 M23 family peptidase [Deminuibacter soli]